MIHWHNLASFVCDTTVLVFETISGVALLQRNGVSVPERNLHLCSYILLGTHKHNISMCWATILHRINKKALWKPYFLGRGYSSRGSVEQKLSWGFAERRSWPMELLINFCIASFIVLFAFTVYVTWLYFFSLVATWKVTTISPSFGRTDVTDWHKGNYSFCGGKSWNERCGASHPGGWDRCSLTLFGAGWHQQQVDWSWFDPDFYVKPKAS